MNGKRTGYGDDNDRIDDIMYMTVNCNGCTVNKNVDDLSGIYDTG